MARGIEGETPNPIPATDALIGDEEQNGKQKERNRERVPNPPTLDHLVAYYNVQGS